MKNVYEVLRQKEQELTRLRKDDERLVKEIDALTIAAPILHAEEIAAAPVPPPTPHTIVPAAPTPAPVSNAVGKSFETASKRWP